MNCGLCGREVTGEIIVREDELTGGIPLVSFESTPDRNWICCDACNTIICHDCCLYPESGYCDDCIKKYKLKNYLTVIGLIKKKDDSVHGEVSS